MKVAPSENAQQQSHSVLMISMLMVAVFFSMASRAIYSPLMPSLQQEMGLSLSAAGTLFLLVSISYAPAILFSGFLAARIGHGKTIVVALASITFGLFITAIAPEVKLLAVGMILIGVGAGIYPPSGIVMINTKISLKRRSTAFAFHEMGPNLALLLSPLLVLVMEPLVGWRGVLFCMTAMCGMATLSFWRWGTSDSGIGVAPNLSTIGTILKLRNTFIGMIILSAGLAGLQGVYAILPAYLVTEYSFSPRYVNFLLAVSRITSVLLLLQTGTIIKHLGKRKTIIWVLLFTSFFTALIGVVKGNFIALVIVVQPALLAVLFPAILSSIADIGESQYQNITYAVILTVGVSFGGGAVPALLGLFGDLGLGWLGFIALAGFMVLSVFFLLATPDFGQD